ncbi:putative PEP-binding protein [Actinomadura viridis]|uniref:putative PEP-binding protein n=1 Tax=Actinomadura viridis TaxID=58110 RepID=UPI00368D0EB0
MSGHLSYGFGIVSGAVRREPEAPRCARDQEDGTIWVVPRVTALSARDVPATVRAVLTPEAVSMYSHEASAVWRLGVPVLAGVDTSRLDDGARVLVDFEEGEIHPGRGAGRETNGPAGRTVPARIDVLAELETAADLQAAGDADGIAVLDIEDVAVMGAGRARDLLREIGARGHAMPAIRFFDRHPRPAPGEPRIGHRGARLASEDAVVAEFLRLVEALDLGRAPTVVLPMYAHAHEFERFAARMAPLTDRLGVTVECAEAALCLGRITPYCSLVEIGLNDLTQFSVAWDRDVVNGEVMSPCRISDGVAALIARVSDTVAGGRAQYSLGLDLRPSPELAEQIAGLGVPAISCPAPLAARWRAIVPRAKP